MVAVRKPVALGLKVISKVVEPPTVIDEAGIDVTLKSPALAPLIVI